MLISSDEGTASIRLSEILRSFQEFHFLQLIRMLSFNGLDFTLLVDLEAINLCFQLSDSAILLLRERFLFDHLLFLRLHVYPHFFHDSFLFFFLKVRSDQFLCQ